MTVDFATTILTLTANEPGSGLSWWRWQRSCGRPDPGSGRPRVREDPAARVLESAVGSRPAAWTKSRIHGRGDATMSGRYNDRWAEFISANPDAEQKDIVQFAGKLMDEYGLSGRPIVPYRWVYAVLQAGASLLPR